MSKHQIKPANNLPKRNHKNKNGTQQRKNIFQLIEPINKKIPLIDKGIKDPLAFADNLITFLQDKHPEELFKLSFNSIDHNLKFLIGSLIETITNLEYTIVFEEDDENETTRILYDIKSNTEYTWYLMEVSWLDEITAPEMKIGYCYLLDKIGNQAHLNVLLYDYKKHDDNCFESEFDMKLEEEQYLSDEFEQKVDEGQVQEAEEEVEEELKRLREWKEKFLEYKSLPYSTFIDYEPKDEQERSFKEYIIKGMQLDFGVIYNFMPNQDVYDDGGVSFEESILIFFDASKGVEEYWFEGMNERGNNGCAEPAGWYGVSKGKVTNYTPEEDIITLKKCFQYLVGLYDDHLNKLRK